MISLEEILDLENLEKKYPDYVVMRLKGMFYDAYGKESFVLAAVTGYKVKKQSEKSKCKCGFPKNTIEKVKVLLEEKKVNYVVYEGNKNIAEKDFGKENSFISMMNSFDENEIETAKAKKSNNVKEVKEINEKISNKKQEAKVYECIGNDLTEAYLILQENINLELNYGKRVKEISCQFVKRDVSKTYALSGIVIYEKEEGE